MRQNKQTCPSSIGPSGGDGGVGVLGSDAHAGARGERLYEVVLMNPPYIPSEGAPPGSLAAFGNGGERGVGLVTRCALGVVLVGCCRAPLGLAA